MSYYVTSENSVLNINNAHLKVSGNIQTDVMKLGAIEFAPPASDVPGTVNFTNVTTGVTTSSNLNVGGTLMLGTVEVVATTHTLENTTALGNVTSNTVQFTNATTGIVATGNVEVGGELTVSGNTTVSSNLTVSGNATVSSNLTVSGDTFSTLYKGGRMTFLTWDYLGQRSTVFSAAGNTGGVATQVNILDNTFDIPSCYHHLGTANLKAYVKIDWRGESQYSWNFGFTIEVTYNGNQIVYSSSSDHSSTSGNKINGLPCISADFTNFDSTPTAASVTSMFSLPNCDVSSGSQLKVQLVGKHGDSGTGQTLWTGRTKGFSTTSPAHELPTTSFFVVLDVEDGY